MKTLYLTSPPLFDLEISLIRELSKYVELDVIEIVNQNNHRSSAFSINNIGTSVQFINAEKFDEMQQYKDMIDLKRWNLAICPSGSISNIIKLSHLIKSFMRNGNYDIVHNTTYSKELLPILPKLRSYPNRIMTIHDPIPHDKPSILEKMRLNVYQRVFDNKLLLSDALLDEYVKSSGISKEKIYFSRLSTYDFLTKYQPTENKYGKYILFFGRITRYKGVELLIEAYKASDLLDNGVKLVIAGKGNLECEQPLEEEGVIMLNRYIENSELASLINHSKYVVLPYRSATQSGCVMSAFAFNKPILATNVGDLPKEVENDVTGLVVDANSSESLRAGLCKLNNEEYLRTMSSNIAAKYQSDSPYSWRSAAKQIYDAYNKILSI